MEKNKKIKQEIKLQNITVYFEYSKNDKKLEDCIENILKMRLKWQEENLNI